MDETVVVSEYTKAQGSGWAVEVYSANGERRTESRWTNRGRAVREAEQYRAEHGTKRGIVLY